MEWERKAAERMMSFPCQYYCCWPKYCWAWHWSCKILPPTQHLYIYLSRNETPLMLQNLQLCFFTLQSTNLNTILFLGRIFAINDNKDRAGMGFFSHIPLLQQYVCNFWRWGYFLPPHISSKSLSKLFKWDYICDTSILMFVTGKLGSENVGCVNNWITQRNTTQSFGFRVNRE